MAARVFISYSHRDEGLRDELEVHLAMLKRQGLIETWHDRRMLAGDTLNWEIEGNLNAADVILLLVSPDFLASDYCYNIEKAQALGRQKAGECRIISVILRPCDWKHTDLSQFLVTPTDGKPVTKWADRDEAFHDVVTAIRNAIQSIGKAGPPLENHRRLYTAEPSSDGSGPPRSSNLRLRKDFSKANSDKFLHDGLDFIAQFFESTLGELQERNRGVECRYRQVDANSFTAAIYREGNKVSSCTIRLRRGEISYSNTDDAREGHSNEFLSCEFDDHKMFFKPMGMALPGADSQKLTTEGAAEYLWSLVMRGLQ